MRSIARAWGADLAQTVPTGASVGTRLVAWEQHRNQARRRAVAKSGATAVSRLWRLGADHDPKVVAVVAANPRTPPVMLRYLLHHRDIDVKSAAAENPALAAAGLRAAANNPNAWVRAAVAASSRAPADVLSRLAGDGFCAAEVGLNERTPPRVLVELSFSQQVPVREAVAANLACPAATVRRLVDDGAEDVRIAIAKRGDCPSDVLESLADDRSTRVRTWVATNLRTQARAVKKLVEDDNPDTVTAALYHPNCPISVIKRIAGRRGPYAQTAATVLARRLAPQP